MNVNIGDRVCCKAKFNSDGTYELADYNSDSFNYTDYVAVTVLEDINPEGRVRVQPENSSCWVDNELRGWYTDTTNLYPIQSVRTTAVATATSTPVNDHVCPSCGNNKVSRTEKLCWLCGGKL